MAKLEELYAGASVQGRPRRPSPKIDVAVVACADADDHDLYSAERHRVESRWVENRPK
jgi:hypothetical protein